MPPRPALFLDRDGTLIDDVDYLVNVGQIRLSREAALALRRANEAGIPVIVVTNQSAIARGMLAEAALDAIHADLSRLLATHGARVEAYYHCPHHPTEGTPPYRRACDCRKPEPGLFLRAARELGLDLARSGAIGDSERDLEAARRAGVPHRHKVDGPDGLGAAIDALLPLLHP
ncbi:MAG: HAD family hydrolase [Planctomycetes bacterium]|nr:HAD family hydrolase [Planctomycetota bacterium]